MKYRRITEEQNVDIVPVRAPTSHLLHRQLVTDLLLILVEVVEGLFVEASLPQNLVLIQQQLTVLVVQLAWSSLGEEREEPEFNSSRGGMERNEAGGPKRRAKLFCAQWTLAMFGKN